MSLLQNTVVVNCVTIAQQHLKLYNYSSNFKQKYIIDSSFKEEGNLQLLTSERKSKAVTNIIYCIEYVNIHSDAVVLLIFSLNTHA